MRGALFVCLLAAGCADGTSSSTKPDGGFDANVDDAAPEASPPNCISAKSCTVVADCASGGTLVGCWQCFLGCCVAVTTGNDPHSVCDAGSACMESSCDGQGACAIPSPSKDGKACGTTCGGIFVYGSSECRSGSCVGNPGTQTPCTDRCYGDYTDCDICDHAGCTGSCDPIPKHADRCFP